MHIRRIEFHHVPPQRDGVRRAWLPGVLLVLLLAALAAAMVFPPGSVGVEQCIG